MAYTALWIPLLPLLAFVVQVSVGRRLPRHGDFVSVLAIFGSFLLACPIFFKLLATGNLSDGLSFSWISLPIAFKHIPIGHPPESFEIVVGILVNNLTAIMLLMVTLCSLLIHLFSVGYMHGEPRYHLFFAYISLFSAAMLGLVIADNLLTFFICWEIMGLCSYLLIGFYYDRPSAIQASLKAFMTTRIGDVLFFLGIAGLYSIFKTSNFEAIYQLIQNPVFLEAQIAGYPAMTFIAFMILMGTIGKSAQFPLHVWLPDAMEGPTPVSALIHAATMVAAGVFLLIRMFPVLEVGHLLPVVAYVGAITAFLSALLAIVQVDIKKVLAYSTISQLGYMVMGVGVGAFGAAFLHLITHACFKACLFLCSGSVIHSVHTQDMRQMGGLRSKMPLTFLSMLISTLAISGVPFFSGFVSKDRILAGALGYGMSHPGHLLIPVLGFGAAGITAFYMFRLIYMTFFGHAQDEHKHHHAHEQPAVMVIPLLILATLSLSIWFAGPTGIERFDAVLPVHWYDHAIENVQKSMGIVEHNGAHHESVHSLAMILSLFIAGAGIGLSTLFYWKKVLSADSFQSALQPVHKLLWNLYYFDSFYIRFLIQRVLLGWNAALARFDDRVVDRWLVDGWSRLTLVVKSVVGKFDDLVVDRVLVDGTGYGAASCGWIIRQFQTGRIQQYVILAIILLCVLALRLVL